uniref:Uncharacterized protein n=1 Tax=Cucumis melo TaxID=3656 RepID=A0A9I9E7S9_CUCME
MLWLNAVRAVLGDVWLNFDMNRRNFQDYMTCSSLRSYKMDEQDPESNYLRLQFSRHPGPRSGFGSSGKSGTIVMNRATGLTKIHSGAIAGILGVPVPSNTPKSAYITGHSTYESAAPQLSSIKRRHLDVKLWLIIHHIKVNKCLLSDAVSGMFSWLFAW